MSANPAYSKSQISTHLDLKEYQTAVTFDPTLPHRNWRHMGVKDISMRFAAYQRTDQNDGPIVDTGLVLGCDGPILFYKFASGKCVAVH